MKLPQAGRREAGGWAQFVLGVKGEFFSKEFWERRQLEQAASHPSLSLPLHWWEGVSLPTRLNPLQPVRLPGPGRGSWGEDLGRARPPVPGAATARLPGQGWLHRAPSGTALPCPWVTSLGSSPEGVCSDVCVRVSDTEIEKQTENSLPRPSPCWVTERCTNLCLCPSLPPTASEDRRPPGGQP